MKVPLLDLVAQYREIKSEMDAAIQRVLDSGYFILGPEVKAIEEEVADYLGVAYGIGVASGTDALILALRALNIGAGDEVILPAYTFFATIGAVLHLGATPVLVDVDEKTYCIDIAQTRAKVTAATKAIIPVHLYGQAADMDALAEIAEEHNLSIIEDNAQAFGAEYNGRKTGGIGDIGCISFFPSKNLGGYGDGGMVVTDNPELAEKMTMLRAHGWKKKYFPEILGYNSRLDSIQAAVLRVKLPHIDQWNDGRRKVAHIYSDALAGIENLQTPYEAENRHHVYHLYILQVPNRDELQAKLKKAEIGTGVYYPQPLHLAEPCKALGYNKGDFPVAERASAETIAIPVYPEMSDEQIEYVIEVVKG
ncbi:MAG TPA: DegT/DnrJ/EryC1/StrS family aminotransferase [Anaerolineales bacterium]|nr:DegT/DnrJ/EryC1/StrS family aminotransferase [Anaerolineales bacterium]